MSVSLSSLDFIDQWGPEKIVCVSDARTGMRGVLVIDNTARGMGKGGTRMSPAVTVEEIVRLARVMTWKWASVDLFFGGAKAGIRADPKDPDKERILRAFVRALANEVPREYVFGLDMGLTENDAAVIQDEIGDRAAAVGTPRAVGGVPYDDWGVTGYGVAEAADAALAHRGGSLQGARVAIQGFGAVGAAAAQRCAELGAVVVGVSTSEGGLYHPGGLDVRQLLAARLEHGDALVGEFAGNARQVPSGEVLVADCDVLIPAATQDVIDVPLAEMVNCQIVVEGANLPVTPQAQGALAARGITVVPDFVANAGGVVAAAYAMDARYSPFPVERDVILCAVASKLRANTELVLAATERSGETSHVTARRLAADRVHAAMRAKGQVFRPELP